jgi:hypothetical protein
MSAYRDARHAYATDATYRAVVDSLVALMTDLRLTPTEVRQAATFAVGLFQDREGSHTFIIEPPAVAPVPLTRKQQTELERRLEKTVLEALGKVECLPRNSPKAPAPPTGPADMPTGPWSPGIVVSPLGKDELGKTYLGGGVPSPSVVTLHAPPAGDSQVTAACDPSVAVTTGPPAEEGPPEAAHPAAVRPEPAPAEAESAEAAESRRVRAAHDEFMNRRLAEFPYPGRTAAPLYRPDPTPARDDHARRYCCIIYGQRNCSFARSNKLWPALNLYNRQWGSN